jgi:hypothetical protein
MSDVGLSFGLLDYAFLALMMGWPTMGVGAVCGALAWRRRRWLGGVIGAVVGLAVGVAVFFWWRGSRLSMNVNYYAALSHVLLVAAPLAIAAAAWVGWPWRAQKDRGAPR